MKIISAGHARFHFESRTMPILVYFNESDEEVQYAVTQLLHVSMLIGRSLVAIDRDALMNNLAIEVFFFAQRFHRQLLQISAEEGQPIFVGEDHHVLLAMAISRIKPHQA